MSDMVETQFGCLTGDCYHMTQAECDAWTRGELVRVAKSREAWKAYAKHFETCEHCRRMMRADDATAILCEVGASLRRDAEQDEKCTEGT